MTLCSQRGDFYESFQRSEVSWIPGIKREIVGGGSRSNQKIRTPRASGLAGSTDGGKHASIHARGFRVERQWIPGSSDPLEAVLASAAFMRIAGCVRAGGEFREGHGGYGGFVREQRRVQQVVIYDYRGVEQATGWISHRGMD